MIPTSYLFTLFYVVQIPRTTNSYDVFSRPTKLATVPSRTKNSNDVLSGEIRNNFIPGPVYFYSRAVKLITGDRTERQRIRRDINGLFSNIIRTNDKLTNSEIEPRNKTYPSLRWQDIGLDENLSRDDLVHEVHSILSKHLSECVTKSGGNPESFHSQKLSAELYSFIEQISRLYNNDNRYHNWHHACHVTLSTSYLVQRLQDEGDHGIGISSDPWYPFVASLIALIHDVKHLGVPNSALEADNHPLSQLFQDSVQERQSIQAALSILMEEYPTLAMEIIKGCPTFLKLVNCVILSTDIESKEAKDRLLEKYNRVMKNGGRNEQERTETALEHIILFADVGFFSQRFETYLRWGKAFFEECLVNHLAGKGFDPRSNWFDVQIGFANNYILPLAKRCETLMPKRIGLVEAVERNVENWNQVGRDVSEQLIKDTMPGEDGTIRF